VLHEAWAFALPSHQENFGAAVLEAVAAGLPVVLSGGVQPRSFVETNELGVVVDRTDPAAIAKGLATVLADADGRRRVGEAGPAAVRDTFSVARVGEQLREMYAQAVGAWRGRSRMQPQALSMIQGGNAGTVQNVCARGIHVNGSRRTVVMPKTRVPVEEIQSRLGEWLRRVEEGERIVITREGRDVAQVKAVKETEGEDSLPSLEGWRASFTVSGDKLSESVQQQRTEERY
jgi:prevent-host-death family protein